MACGNKNWMVLFVTEGNGEKNQILYRKSLVSQIKLIKRFNPKISKIIISEFEEIAIYNQI